MRTPSLSSLVALGRREFLLGSAAAATLSCGHLRADSAAPRAESSAIRVVLVAIDGVRPADVFHGSATATPHLRALGSEGIAWGAGGGPEFLASGPNFVSLPGYAEMLSGSSRTGCGDNQCAHLKAPTLLDDFQSRRPDDPTRAAAFSSWQPLERACSLRQSGVVSCGRRGGYRRELLAAMAPTLLRWSEKLESPFGAEFRPDIATARLALNFLDTAQPEFLFVSLGETDEYAHQGDRQGYLRAMTQADRFIGSLRGRLRSLEKEGLRTLLLVTTDHGRSKNFKDHGKDHPESAHSFLVVGGSLSAKGRPRAVAYLRDIAPTIRACGGIFRPDAGDGQVLVEVCGAL